MARGAAPGNCGETQTRGEPQNLWKPNRGDSAKEGTPAKQKLDIQDQVARSVCKMAAVSLVTHRPGCGIPAGGRAGG